MSRFLGIFILLTLGAGLLIHSGVDLPWYLQWVGDLPGDLIIKKNGMTIYLPLTSSILISAALSFILSLFTRH